MKTVIFQAYVLTHYRIPFHTRVKEILNDAGIAYHLVYSAPLGKEKAKSDAADLHWATKVNARLIDVGGKGLIWQPTPSHCPADLVIVGQENRLVNSYFNIVRSWVSPTKVAFFGHGRNFQSLHPKGLPELWKRFWATKVHWWFTYTPSCGDLIASYGFPSERITVFNNSIDLKSIATEKAMLDQSRTQELRARSFCGSENIAVYVGGIYKEKRIEFLLAAARKLREIVPDFQLIVIGAGIDAALVETAAKDAPWIHYQGPKFGIEKTELVSLAKVWLMPGLVGLAVLDSFAYETPMVTTQLPYHSPEFDYLEDGVNGVIVPESDDVEKYAAAVNRVLSDERYRKRLIEGARLSREKYSMDRMAERFAEGVMRAIMRPN